MTQEKQSTTVHVSLILHNLWALIPTGDVSEFGLKKQVFHPLLLKHTEMKKKGELESTLLCVPWRL